MPTYEYQCQQCDDRFERFQKMSDPPVAECPSCGGGVKKVLHPPAIAFVGPGFYVNDYKKASAPARAEQPAKEMPKAEPKSETKTETKPEPVAA